MIVRLVAVIAALLLAACGGGGGPTAPVVEGDGGTGDPADPAGSWVLVGAEPAIEVPVGARVTMTVDPADGTWQVGGTSACNSYGGTVVLDGSGWRADDFGATAMGCDEPRMAAEQAYLAAVAAVDTWARPSSDELVLTGPDVELRYELLPPVPTADLVGTTWVLDGLATGTGPDAAVSSTVAGADEATLELRADGTLEASTGCRTFSGEWVETGDEILFTAFGVRDDSPHVSADGTPTCDEDVIRQEDQVLSVLGDGFRAEVAGGTLTLVSRDGLALTYRAAAGS